MGKSLLKSCSLLLAGFITFTALNNVLGAGQNTFYSNNTVTSTTDKISSSNAKAQAINLFKKKYQALFGLNLDSGNYTISANIDVKSESSGSVWNISIVNQAANEDNNVSIDINSGEIVSYSHYPFIADNNTQKIHVPLITLQEARKVSEDFINKLNPNISKSIKEYPQYTGKSTDTGYYFNYRRIYNGIPFDYDGIYIKVDSNTGKVISYSCTWHKNFLITPSKNIGSSTLALETYKNLVKLRLYYKYINGKFVLTYLPDFDYNKYVSCDGKTVIDSYSTKTSGLKQSNDLTINEKNQIYNSSKPNTIKVNNLEAAKKYASTFVKKYFKDNYSLTNAAASTANYYGDPSILCWYLIFANSKNPSQTISLNMRQDNGQIYSLTAFYRNNDLITLSKNSVKSTIKWSDAYNKAIDLIKDLYPQYINDLDTKKSENLESNYLGNPSDYYFNFNRTHDQIPCDNDSIGISINKTTGEPSNISVAWMKNPGFSSSVPAIKEEDAKKIYFNKCEPKLQYIFLKNNPSDNSNSLKDKAITYKAIEVYGFNYTLNDNTYNSAPISYINATNGKPYDYSDSPIIETKVLSPELIKNSAAKKQIQIFSDSGFLAGKSFTISSPITRKEALTLIVQAKEFSDYSYNFSSNSAPIISYTDISKNDDFYKYILAAIKDGTIPDKKAKFLPDEPLTKLEMAKWLINGISADDLTKISDILNINFDINKEPSNNYKGYIAMFNALHFNLEDNKFNPNDKVTWEDMIYGLYNSMKYLRAINN